MPLMGRWGSRAGRRSATRGGWDEAAAGFVEPCWGAETFIFVGFMLEEGAGEPALVRGVWLLFEARDEAFTYADMWLVLALKTDDAVLA